MAVNLVDPKADTLAIGYFRKGSAVERAIATIPNYGSGPPRNLYIVRGNARAMQGYPTSSIVIDSIEPFVQVVAPTVRPKGRDWFVRAGESGGDGSRDKPFRDPFQALEKAVKGDRILVVSGEYGGKLKVGKWVVDKQYLTRSVAGIGTSKSAIPGILQPCFTGRRT